MHRVIIKVATARIVTSPLTMTSHAIPVIPVLATLAVLHGLVMYLSFIFPFSFRGDITVRLENKQVATYSKLTYLHLRIPVSRRSASYRAAGP